MEKRKKTGTRIILFLCIAGIIIYLIFKIVNAFGDNARAFAEDLPITYSLAAEDSNLIAVKYRSKITVNKVLNSKVRNSISLVTFDQKYSLIFYKIGLSKDISLKTLINTQIKSVDRSTGYTYSVVDNNFFRFQYKAGIVKPASQIYLTLSGDSLQTIAKNDSTVSYHLLCSNLSLRYTEEEPIDIYVAGQQKAFGRTVKIPMDILFLKRNRAVYLLLLVPNNPDASIAPNLLYDITTDLN